MTRAVSALGACWGACWGAVHANRGAGAPPGPTGCSED